MKRDDSFKEKFYYSPMGWNLKMSRKSGSTRQQSVFECTYCDFTTKKNSNFILHVKEKHGIEL